jgi:hypothetical protein
MYQYLKKLLTKHIIFFQKRIEELYHKRTSRQYMKSLIRKRNLPKLTNEEVRQAKSYYKSKGYILKNTYWHRYYKSINGEFHKDYVPYDIFLSKIGPRLNQQKQWPALLDKNMLHTIFKDFEQPKHVVQNINGFYYVNDQIVDLNDAIKAFSSNGNHFIIKPTLESGQGKMVNAFTVKDSMTSYKNLSLVALFKLYHKDFIVQEFLEQSDLLNSLNPSSVNTLRVVSYLNKEGVHILVSVLRIGKSGSSIDNFSAGGILCGVLEDGYLKDKGYDPKGTQFTETATGIILKDCKIPNYDKVQEMTKSMHVKVPYFKIISWDIAINKSNMPVLIEYNTYKQGIDIQMVIGPLFGKFADEILDMGLKPY